MFAQLSSIAATVKKKARLRRAAFWHFTYKAQFQLSSWKLKYSVHAIALLLLLLIFISLSLSATIQKWLEIRYPSEDAIEGLKELILSVGSALIGAAAIAMSLVLFAMQVNIERMPHGLFRRLNSDWKLLGAFSAAFLLAIGIATISTFTDQSLLSIVVLAVSWSILIILVLFVYAYRRALILVNPLHQLTILLCDTNKELQTWARRSCRARPFFETEQNPMTTLESVKSTVDLARTLYFQINKHWTDNAKQAIRHAMSFARRYSEQGDYEVSGASLNAVVAMNAAYIGAKGKTFFANDPIVDNPFATDGFINETLDHLRQYAQTAILRRDEQQIEQALQAIAALIDVYLGIDYSKPFTSKSHACLAGGYLADAIEAVVPHGMADVLLEGQRLMGRSAQLVLAKGNPNDVVGLSEKITLIACTGCAKEDYRPVTMEGMTQLSYLTFDLLRCRNGDMHFALGRIRQNASTITRLFLKVTEEPLSNTHSFCLGPYYSSTTLQSFRARLVELVNALLNAQPDNADAIAVIYNIEQWADGLHKTERDLLLESIRVKSFFTFDMIHWITGLSEVLLAVSNAPACADRLREKLQNHASRLIATLTWIPDDRETVIFLENFQMTETLFEAALVARNRCCEKNAREIGKILLSWTLRSGKYQTGQGILQRGLCGSAVLARHYAAAHLRPSCYA